MSRVAWLAGGALAVVGCIRHPSEQVTPGFKNHRFNTIAILAAGSSRDKVILAQRARDKVRKAKVVKVVSVQGLWDTEPDIVKALCAPEQSPALDGFAIVDGDRLTLYDCGTRRVAWEADGAFEGVDYMTKKFLEYLRRDS